MADNTKLLLVGAAGVAVWWFYFRTPAAAAVAPAATGGTPAGGTSTGGTPAAPAAPVAPGTNQLAGIQARANAAAAASVDTRGGRGVVSMPADNWGWYLNNELSALGLPPAPDPGPIFTAAISGWQRGDNITQDTYWAAMLPALRAQGLSGFGLGIIPGYGLGWL